MLHQLLGVLDVVLDVASEFVFEDALLPALLLFQFPQCNLGVLVDLDRVAQLMAQREYFFVKLLKQRFGSSDVSAHGPQAGAHFLEPRFEFHRFHERKFAPMENGIN